MALTKVGGVPFKQARGDGGRRSTTQCVVIHCTDNTAPAANEASYAMRREDGTSAHFYIDSKEVIQALRLDHIAYGCYPIGNSRSVQFELVGRSNAVPRATWQKAAKYVAIVCREYKIPIVKLSPAALRAGKKGVVGHGDVTAAWGQGSHTDPGSKFPWKDFIAAVKAEYNKLYGKKPVVTTPPKPVSGGFDTHKVVKGETLWGLALTYYGDGTKYKQIAADSKIDPNKGLRVGQPLKIRKPHKAVVEVQKGDSLFGIAKAHKVPLANVQKLNKHSIPNANRISVGQAVRLA